MNEIRDAKREARRIWQRAFPGGIRNDGFRAKHPNTNIIFKADICPDHFSNLIIFGGCWKHNPDGSLKSMFNAKVV